MNTTVVMAGAQGIILSWDATKLQLHGGHINITKSWARSLLIRMGFVLVKYLLKCFKN